MTINDAKFAALRAQGYTGALSDMLLAWLRSNTGLTTGGMNDLWYALCLAQGTPAGALPDMKAALWTALGYDSEYAFWLDGGSLFDPPGCSITLTGDIAAVFGGQPLDIAGQTVSKTVPVSPSNIYASSDAGSVVSWIGWRGTGYQASVYSTALDSLHGATLISSTLSASVQVLWSDATSAWLVLISGSVVGTVAGTALSKVAFSVNGSSGDVRLYVDGTSKTKTDYAGLGGLFSGLTVLAAQTLGTTAGATLSEGDTYAATVFTAAADLEDVGFPAGTLDWCGNAVA